MNELEQIIGSGGGKGGGAPRVAQEADNTLRSSATVRVLEVVSEGEVEGLVGGAKGIFLDNTPLMNDDGSYNFDRVQWDGRVGLPDQPHMQGFPSAEAVFEVSAPVEFDTPITYTTSASDIDAVRVAVVLTEGLSYQDPSNGDLNGTSVEFGIDVAPDGGVFVQALSTIITGKTTSPYEKEFRVERPGLTGPWSVRVRRITPDAVKSNVRDSISFARVTEIKDVQLSYPNTAYVGVAVDAQSTGNKIPTRSYRVRGIKVQVPTNYDPITRTYTGIWGGTFKRAWTDNPAWVLYDLLTNERYGAGELIKASDIDKYSFYDAAVYNDALVPNGKGGTEPRYTFNTVIAGQEHLLRVIQNVAGAMRSVLLKEGNLFRLQQDRPSAAVKLITNSNVVDGVFSYSSSDVQSRHTVVNVTFNNKNDRYYPDVISVEADPADIARYGYNPTEVQAFGATTEGQAIRVGKWLLDTELRQLELVAFQMSFNGFDLRVGDVVNLWDQDYTTLNSSGRILKVVSAGDTHTVTLDRSVTLNPTSVIQYGLSILTDASILETGSTDVITISSPVPPVVNDVYCISDVVQARQFKITSITEEDKHLLNIQGVQYDPEKFTRIELGINVPAPVYSGVKPERVHDVTDIDFRVNSYVTPEGIRRDLLVSFKPPSNSPAVTDYGFFWRRNSGQWMSGKTESPSFEIRDIREGMYEVRIVTYSINGTSSPGATASYAFTLGGGTGSPLAPVLDLRVKGTGGLIFEDRDLHIEFRNNPLNESISAVLKDFEVRVMQGDNILRRAYVERVQPGELAYYTYRYDENALDHAPASRNVWISVYARDTDNKLSIGNSETFTNPAPLAPTIDVQPGVQNLKIEASIGSDSDHAGTIIWGSTNSAFVPSEANKLYQGSSSFYIVSEVTETMYFRAAHYDSFGVDALNISSLGIGTPSTAGGIPVVSTLPASPAEVNGELAVWLQSSNPNLTGIWGWDGSAWKFTRDGANLIANSVAADKIAVNQLGAISANLGSITSGSITFDQTSYIRGGALTFGTGSGLWMGYASGDYKWRVGTPGSSRAEWNGSAFNIYDSSGNLTISSGVVDYSKIGNKTGFAALNKITALNVSTYIESAAIRNAQIGGHIYSSNYTGWPGEGWLLNRDGDFYGNNVYARGDIEASSLKANTLMVNKGNIVDAAVDTLKIAGNAVTVPVAATGTTSATTASADFGGAPVALIVTANAKVTATGIGGRDVVVTATVKNGGVTIKTFNIIDEYWSGASEGSSITLSGMGAWVIGDTSGGGFKSYSITLSGSGFDTSNHHETSILAIGVKR